MRHRRIEHRIARLQPDDLAWHREDVPVGFVRVVKTGPDCEMVVLIGNRETGDRQLGASAIREGMKLAFFDMRAEKLTAKIHPDNARSLKTFQRCGSCRKAKRLP